MNILIKNIPEKEIKADALVLPLFENDSIDIYSDIDFIVGGIIKRLINSKEFTGKQNQTALLHVRDINSDRILLIGLGKQSDITTNRIREAGGKAFSFLRDIGVKDIAVSTGIFGYLPKDFKAYEKPAFYFIEGGLLSLYRFEKYKKSENDKEIKTVSILGIDKDIPVKWLQTVVSAVNFAKDLVNTPSNDMTPTILSKVAESLSGKKIKVKILEKKDIEKEGMGAYLSVSKGSNEPPKLIVIEYRGEKRKPLAIIGKSITFDSGGISLKPAEGMEKMKYDMSGGASVLAIIKAASELELPVNIVGILPATENLPGGSASKPGDIVKTITGKTIEIINTDAEGRLTLADAIGYAIKYYKPEVIIDIATLTGACSIALGNEAIAMMGNNNALMEKLKKASDDTYERVWQMPLYDEYKDYIKSDVADIKNSGGKNGSLVTAGYFLREFAGDTPWAHLDIAGTAWNDKDKPYMPKGATAIGVRLILNFLKEL
ncbi:leucyl aminopeptidase [hot springs metagenome]|uniref:leucyl aminopeptidase n=1 Tax=hot springs metagenome TaxID=433727 RepID=A0A5J4L6P8_9ZZZZ